jgi:hypothetical protein
MSLDGRRADTYYDLNGRTDNFQDKSGRSKNKTLGILAQPTLPQESSWPSV